MTDSDVSMNLEGGDAAWRTAMQPALAPNLMAQVVEKANMQKAWQRVKSNKGAPGSDGMTLEDFPAYARLHWPTIRQSLLEGTYRPQPVRRVSIPKPNGRGERLLGVPCVVDRVIQQAILQVLTPIFDPSFSALSFGSRPQRSAHGAIAQIKGYLKAGHRIAVDLDLEKFFDTVHHDVLMSRVSRKVHDKVLLKLIGLLDDNNHQMALVTQYEIEAGDTLSGLLLSEVAYGYGVVPIWYRPPGASATAMPSEDQQLHPGDQLVVIATIRGLRRVEQGQRAQPTWQVQVDRALTPDSLFEGASEIARIAGCKLGDAREFMAFLPGVLPLPLYRHQAERLVRSLNRVQVRATILDSGIRINQIPNFEF